MVCGNGLLKLPMVEATCEGCPVIPGCPANTLWWVNHYAAFQYRLQSTTLSAPCFLLSNITQLIPSNGWNGGIKQSALGS